ncbi:ADP-ribosyltransferase [Nonomuraea sp. NPDC023979]|uniref:ADP-ribosyltransferase n=1 Tax=Nonomuraea sp. NPDC023979 TaxID=3154796 RepID=UPI0034076CEB
MVPEGVRALKASMQSAEASLASIGDELWELLRGAWLSPMAANTIRQVAAWAGQQGPEINRRLLLLERIELDRPDLFGGGKPVMVDESLLAPGAVLPVTGGFWDRLGQQLQATFDPELNSGDSMIEVVKGAVEGVAGAGETVLKLTPNRVIFDRMGWERDINDVAQAVVSGVQDPIGFAKAAVDWDTWASNPERAFGRLVPDILAALGSGGASTAVSGTTRAVGLLGKAAKSVTKPKPSTPHTGDRLSGEDTPPDASKGTPTVTGANPLDHALRHATNAEGRAWARDNMPLPDVTPEQLRALEFYGGIGHRRINEALRARAADPDAVWSPVVADEIAAIDRAIAVSRLPSDVVLHRGVGSKYLEALNVDIRSPREMEALEGRVITEAGYLSTSVGRRAGFDGDLRMMFRVPKGHAAINLFPVTKLRNEREILLRRDTSYVVRAVYRKDGQWYMEADVVPDGWTKPPDWEATPSMDADVGWKGPPDD